MKTSATLLIIFFSLASALAQPITGQWSGTLTAGALNLKIVFHITKTDSGYISTMDSPDQGAKGIPVTTTSFEGKSLKLELASLRIEYKGVLKNDTLTGTFTQAGNATPLVLSKGVVKAARRPQEPKPPYSYYTEDITFRNSTASITLAGTLTLPAKEGNYPAVILIGGSGPQNRDGELFGHKPLLVLADHLTKNGIAVLRFDDRGVAKSEGSFQAATIPDFISDAESALTYLKTRKEINNQKIGLIGHSEGGIIVPAVAAKSPDAKFIVMLAGPGMQGDKLLLLQIEKIQRQMGAPETIVQESHKLYKGAYEIILNSPVNDLTLSKKISTYFNAYPGTQAPEGQINALVNQVTNPWMVSFLKYDPIPVLRKIKIPVLALNGGMDVQVPAPENLSGIKNALTEAGNKSFTTKEYPNLNHLFQPCKSCLPFEYGEIEETFSPVVLDDISGWIKDQTSQKP